MLSGRIAFFLTLLLSFSHICLSQEADLTRSDSLFERGKYFHSIRQHDSAAHCFIRSAQLAEEQEAWAIASDRYTNASGRYAFTRNREEAIHWGQKALDIAEDHIGKDSWETARAHFSQFLLFTNLRQAEGMYHHARKAIHIYEKRAETEELDTKKLIEIGFLYEMLEDYGSAVEALETALNSVPEDSISKNERVYLLGADRLQSNYISVGRFQDALDLNDIIHSLSLSLERHDIIMNGYYTTALTYRLMGDLEQALLYLRQAPPFKKRNVEMARVFRRMGELDSALVYLHEAMTLQENPAMHQGFGIDAGILVNLAEIYHKKGMLNEANDYFKKTEAWYNTHVTLDKYHADFLARFSQFELETGQVSSAEEHIARAIHMSDSIFGPDHRESAFAYYVQAQVLANKGDHTQTMDAYLRTLRSVAHKEHAAFPDQLPGLSTVFSKSIYLQLLISVSEFYFQKYQEAQDQEAIHSALQLAQHAVAITDSLRLGVRQPESRTQWAEKGAKACGLVLTLLHELYQETSEAQYAEMAFPYFEQARSLLLTADLQDRHAMQYSGLPDSLLRQESILQSELAFYEQSLLEASASPGSKDSLTLVSYRDKQFQLRNEWADFKQTLEKEYSNYFQLKYQLAPVSLASIQKHLAEDGNTLLEYYQGDSAWFVMAITADKIVFRRIVRSEQTKEEMIRFREMVRNTRGYDAATIQEYGQIGFGLFKQLFLPIWDDAWKKAIVVPDGDLWGIPIEALLNSPPSATARTWKELPFVLRACQIHYAYSASMLLRNDRDVSSREPLISYAPSYDGQLDFSDVRSPSGLEWDAFAALPFTQPEALAVAELMKGEAVLADRATKKHFIENAGQYDILHLAMHGFFYQQNPLYSGLVFAADSPQDSSHAETDDEILHAYDIYQLSLPASLAVLSACETGAGSYQAGEGIMSLARAFRYAGCPNIIMSQWEADGAATKELMILFYEFLAQGKSKSESLHLAKISYLDQNPAARTAPSYWSNFVLIGQGTDKSSSRSPLWYILWISLLIAATGIYRLSRTTRSDRI